MAVDNPAAQGRIWAMRTFLTSLALLFCLPLSGCPQVLPPHNYATEPDPRKKDFVLGPSDRLQITVWRNPNLSTSAMIRPDGTITMPLVGDLKAAGRTTRQLQAEIKQRVQAYVMGATVTVAVTEVNSYRFTVAGQVARPGLFRARTYLTINEAVAMAGGPTRFANAKHAIVVRRDPKTRKIRRIPVDYTAIASGKSPRQDIVVLPGDTIYMP